MNLQPLDDLTRQRIDPAAAQLAIGALTMSLLLAFRRERIPAPPPGRDEDPRPADASRPVRLFGLEYEVTREHGPLDEGQRRRRTLKTAAGRAISWRAPARDFPADPGRSLTILAAAGRAIASIDPASGAIVFHEADLAGLHGLGRRGRALVLWPALLSTAGFALVAHRVLAAFVASSNGLLPAAFLGPSVVTLAALFALGVVLALGVDLAILSAILRKVRRVQLRRHHEPALRAWLSSVSTPTDRR